MERPSTIYRKLLIYIDIDKNFGRHPFVSLHISRVGAALARWLATSLSPLSLFLGKDMYFWKYLGIYVYRRPPLNFPDFSPSHHPHPPSLQPAVLCTRVLAM